MNPGNSWSAMCVAVALTIVFVACDNPTDPEPGLPSLAGSYVLTHVDGQPLPALFYYSEPYDTRSDYVGGTLDLAADSTFSVAYTIRYTRGTLGGRVQPGSQWDERMEGTYSVNVDGVVYRFQVGTSPPLTAPMEILDSHTIQAPSFTASRATFSRQ